jgi:hypothetical protein
MNPLTIRYRFGKGEEITKTAGFPFSAQCKTDHTLKIESIPLFLWDTLWRRKIYTATAEISVDCDPELKVLIDEYTRRKALESMERGADNE